MGTLLFRPLGIPLGVRAGADENDGAHCISEEKKRNIRTILA